MKSLLRNFSGFSLKTFSLAVGMLGSLLLTSHPSQTNWVSGPLIPLLRREKPQQRFK